MLIFLVVVFALYALLVLILCWGWASLEDKELSSTALQKMSVVVAFRNEETTLPTLIESFSQLKYPTDRTEILLVDDHSEDRSVHVVRGLISNDSRYTLLTAESSTRGKKAAITRAISKAGGDIVVVTDADCQVPVNWLTSINTAFGNNSVQLVTGPVRLSEQDWFAKLQAMEFASLIGATGATIALHKPTMCNAANLAFRRTVFHEVNGFAGNEGVSSGDDHFLMKKISQRWNGSVAFLYNDQAIVTARASSTLGGLVQQRLRWAGKWRMRIDSTSLLALGILAFHVCYLVLFGAWIFASIPTTAFIALVCTRLFVEVIYLLPVCRFLDTRWRWSSFALLQFFYPIYAVSIGFLSQILTVRWKGREVTTGVWTGIS